MISSILYFTVFLFVFTPTKAIPSPLANQSIKISQSDLAERQYNVHFTSTWPDKLVGGESISMTWEGSDSGKYSLAWVEEYNGGEDLLLNFVFQNEVYDHYDFWFAPARCWEDDATFRFIIWDSESFPLPNQRAYGPKLPLVAGDNEPDTC